MDYANSICFSATHAEVLNRKAFLINRSLYLFAYYEPKPYYFYDSKKSSFMTAIINLYGLFWDCGPFVFSLLFGQDSILLTNWKRIQKNALSLKSCINSFRSIFCHNNSDQFPLNEEKVTLAIQWASEHQCNYQSITEITEDDWGHMLDSLIKEIDVFVYDLNTALDELRETTDTIRQEIAIKKWIKAIAVEYQKKPDYLLNTMVGLYQYYLQTSKTARDSQKDLRYLTQQWICTICNLKKEDWQKKWLEATKSDQTENKDITNTKIYASLKDWPNLWAEWYGCSPEECDEPPLPASIFFRILADDIDKYVHNPSSFHLPLINN